jgi:hypothetical protein
MVEDVRVSLAVEDRSTCADSDAVTRTEKATLSEARGGGIGVAVVLEEQLDALCATHQELINPAVAENLVSHRIHHERLIAGGRGSDGTRWNLLVGAAVVALMTVPVIPNAGTNLTPPRSGSIGGATAPNVPTSGARHDRKIRRPGRSEGSSRRGERRMINRLVAMVPTIHHADDGRLQLGPDESAD